MVFEGEEEPKRKVSKYSEKEATYLVCWYEEKKKKKEEGKEGLCSQGKSKTEKERKEIFWRSEMSRWTDRQTGI